MLHTYYDSAGRVPVARRGAAIINVLPGPRHACLYG